MTSELRVDNLKGSTTGGSINVLSEGTSVTTNLQQGLAKVWTNFNGTGTIAIRDSFNTSSLTDNSTGNHLVNINNDMSNDDYSATQSTEAENGNIAAIIAESTTLTGSFGFYVYTHAGSLDDSNINTVTIHGDLA